MKYIIITSVSFLILISLSCKDKGVNPIEDYPPGYQHDIPWPSMDANPWAIHHGDAQFTGRSRFSGPQLGQVEWMVKIPTTNLTHDSFLSPVVGRDSTIYFISYKDTASPGSFLYAMKFDGTIKWTYPIQSPTQKNSSPPVISSDGTIYVADWAGNLTAIRNDGTMKWKLTLPRPIRSMMNLDKEGNLYGFASDGILYCFSPSGNINWSLTLANYGSSSSAVVFSPDGNTMYVTGLNLFAVARTGELKWSYDALGEGTRATTPLVNAQGDIFLESGLISISSNGILKYMYIDSSFIPDYIDPTIDKNGNIYIGGYNGIISLNYKGELRWRKSFDLNYYFGLISDKNGTVYFLTRDNKLTSIDSLGNLKWQLQLDGQSYYSPAISAEGRMYLGTVEGTAKYFYSIK